VALKALKTLKVLQHAQEEIGFGGYEDFKVFRVRGGGQVARGGVPTIYIQSYTFWEEIGCIPDSSAASKPFKGGIQIHKMDMDIMAIEPGGS